MNRIKQLRQQNGINQEDLARLLNVQRSVVSKYEAGKVSLTSDTLNKLSEIFKVSIDYILCKSNDPNPYNKKENPVYSEPYKRQTLEELILENGELSEESKKDLLKQMELLKLRDNMKKYKEEASSDLRPRLN